MYTVQEVYDKTLQQADKMGSDYLALPEALSRLKKAAYDFIGQKSAQVEKTQEVTEDLQSLVKIAPFIPVIDPNVTGTFLVPFPNDFFHRLRITVFYGTTEKSRLPRFQKFGEANTNEVSPYKKPDRKYPLITNYSDYMNINTGGAIPSKIAFTYFKKPVFGTEANMAGVWLELPVQAIEEILALMIAEWMVQKGDSRGPSEFQLKETYRQPR